MYGVSAKTLNKDLDLLSLFLNICCWNMDSAYNKGLKYIATNSHPHPALRIKDFPYFGR